jgi:hypothetical protein
MQQRSRLIPPLRYLAERLRCWWIRKGISGMASIDEDLNSVRTQIGHARNTLSSAEARLNDIERRAREEESGSWASGRGKHPKATKNAAFVISDSFLHHVAEIGGV